MRSRELADAKLMLYPIDASGVLTGLRAHVNIGPLKELAEQTGGRAYYNKNDVAGFMQAAFDDAREGYVLTYSPRGYRQDGSAHQVRLKAQRKGVVLRYRPGYAAERAP